MSARHFLDLADAGGINHFEPGDAVGGAATIELVEPRQLSVLIRLRKAGDEVQLDLVSATSGKPYAVTLQAAAPLLPTDTTHRYATSRETSRAEVSRSAGRAECGPVTRSPTRLSPTRPPSSALRRFPRSTPVLPQQPTKPAFHLR